MPFQLNKSARVFMTQTEFRRIVCVVLCLLTWRGPVPVLHSHAAESPARLAAARHLESYHLSADRASVGWHFHVMLWSDFTEECPNEDKPRPPHELNIIRTCAHGGVVIPRETLDYGLCVRSVASVSTQLSNGDLSSNPRARPSSFLTSLLSIRPLSAVLGVSLC